MLQQQSSLRVWLGLESSARETFTCEMQFLMLFISEHVLLALISWQGRAELKAKSAE